MSRRWVRDLWLGLAGVGVAIALFEVTHPHPDQGAWPAALPKAGGDLLAWTLASGPPGVQLLAPAEIDGIRPCLLPTTGMITPILDPSSGLPARIAHWQTGGPRLWLMSLSPDATDAPQGRSAAHEGVASCPAGRVLVPADTIMNHLYERSLQAAAAR
jgi:hypothetical protein